MLSFFNLIVITPYKILVNRKKIILEIIIILCFFYQVSVGFNMVMGGGKRTVPLLYEGEWDNGEDINLINKTKMVEEIKNTIFFKRKYKEDDKEIIIEFENILNSPLYTGALKLVGVLEHTDKANSIAILEFKRKQDLYLEGDKIDAITIIKILKDRIIVNENGGYYTLVIL